MCNSCLHRESSGAVAGRFLKLCESGRLPIFQIFVWGAFVRQKGLTQYELRLNPKDLDESSGGQQNGESHDYREVPHVACLRGGTGAHCAPTLGQ